MGEISEHVRDPVDDPAAPIRPLRIDLLQTFVVAAHEAGLTSAARRLYLTPSGVSRRVQALEAQVGAQLFDRAGRSMPLTPAGRRLLPEAEAFIATARRVLASLDVSQDSMHMASTTTELAIGEGI